MLAPEIAPRLAGMERADSVAFDFHKWAQVPYDAGFILVRDGALHYDTFASPAAYLKRGTRGLAAGSPWPCDFGPDLSRGFRALKTWFTIKVYGAEKLGAVIAHTCELGQYMQQRIKEMPELELLAPVSLNIVCFRYHCADADQVNSDIVVALQESGIAVPSTTTINGRLAIRAAIVNHRTSTNDIDALLKATIAFGDKIIKDKQHIDTSVPPVESHFGQQPLMGLAKIMRLIFSGIDLAPLGQQLVARAQKESGSVDANAFMDLFTILLLRGDRELAMDMQAQALKLQQIYTPPTAAGQTAIRVLAIMGAGDLMANTPIELLLENSDVALDLLYLSPDLPLPVSVPDHDVLFVAIGESEENIPLLQELDSAIKSWPRPVLNMPGKIALLSRDSACALLKAVPGVVMPDTVRIARQTLEQIGREELTLTSVLADGKFPVIVRPVDSHAGKGLDKLDNSAAIAGYLGTVAQDEFYISRFVDYRREDGLFRKYRIVLIEGHPFVCHMGISSHWMIHYLNAGMIESAEKRAEEESFMANFDEEFARRHKGAFGAIYERIGLDYLGIDCGETADGSLLIFEVDSNMIVHALDPVDIFPYKQPQMRKVFAAFREMLDNAIKRGL